MTKLASLLTSMLLLWPLLAPGATYYVGVDGNDSRTCTQAQTDSPSTRKRTIQNAINNCWRNPGDILYIHTGTYPEQLHGFLSTSWPSGTAAQPMVIASAPGERAIIAPVGSDPSNYDIVYVRGAYLIFDSLTIHGQNVSVPDPGGGRCLVTDETAGHHVTVRNSLLHDCPGNVVSMTGDANTTQNNEMYGARGYGVYQEAPNGLIENNYIHDVDGYAIHMYNGHPACANTCVTNVTVRGNVLRHNGYNNNNPAGSCALVCAKGSDCKVYNNLIDDHNGCGLQAYSGEDNAQFYNNTIVGVRDACIQIDNAFGAASNTQVRNNICYGNGQSISDNGADSTISNNNPNTNNPRFVDPPNGNYRLQTSPTASDALNAAINLSSLFTSDITTPTTGLVRPATGPWDQGAYEMEAGGSSGLIPEKGTFFLDDTGTPNTTDCHAATGTVGSPSAAPFGDYATARICMLPGSTLYFRTGTYPPLDSMSTPFAGGSPSDGPTTLAAYPGETVTLQATGGSPVVVYLHNATTDHFLILQGLILDGLNIANSNGFAALGGVNDIRLDGVEIKNTYYEGVFLQQTSNVELRNATKVHNSAFASVGVVGLDRTTNTTITGSEVYASGGPGISSYGGNSNLIIEKSTIRNTPSGKGILLGNVSSPDSGVRIANNLIYGNTYGIHLQAGTTGAGLYYNTIWSNSVACMLFDSGVTVSEAINNICWQVATLTNNAGSGMVLTTNQTTDPLFASTTPGDVNFLHLCGAVGVPVAGCTGKSPAIDTGTPIPSLTSDYASKARPDGVQVDKGAFEEIPVPVAPAQVGLAPVYRTTHFLTLLP